VYQKVCRVAHPLPTIYNHSNHQVHCKHTVHGSLIHSINRSTIDMLQKDLQLILQEPQPLEVLLAILQSVEETGQSYALTKNGVPAVLLSHPHHLLREPAAAPPSLPPLDIPESMTITEIKAPTSPAALSETVAPVAIPSNLPDLPAEREAPDELPL
jgi:hypothetical protein